MIHIDTSALKPSAKWTTKAYELTKKLTDATTKAERDDIINSNKHWSDLKGDLEKLSYGKCWYSEAREIHSHYHVDHFRPKKKAKDSDDVDRGGYWWLSYDWTNYRLCGSVGNTKKGDRFPVKYHKANGPGDPLEDEMFYFLDPTDADDVKLLNFDEEGKAIPASPNSKSWDYVRASETIKWYDLNFPKLQAERQRIWGRISRNIQHIEYLNQKQNLDPTSTGRALLRTEYEKLREQIAPCTELSSTVRCCLRSSGLGWAIRLLEEPIKVEDYCREYMPAE